MMEIDFKKMDGLVPVVVQDNANGELLMVGFANSEAYEKTLESGYVTFFSRTRHKLWIKGKTSGSPGRVQPVDWKPRGTGSGGGGRAVHLLHGCGLGPMSSEAPPQTDEV